MCFFFFKQKLCKHLKLPDQYHSYFALFIVAQDEDNSIYCKSAFILLYFTVLYIIFVNFSYIYYFQC